MDAYFGASMCNPMDRQTRDPASRMLRMATGRSFPCPWDAAITRSKGF